MTYGLVKYSESLNEGELLFLVRKEAKERRTYYKVYQILMFMSFLLPFAGAWHRAYLGAPNAFSAFRYFFITGILLFISTFSTYATYRLNLRRVQLDIRYKTKTIEINRITRKLYVTAKDTYHFYIDSSIKLSIEVSADDYEHMRVGDEVAIEYTTYSRLYLGYF